MYARRSIRKVRRTTRPKAAASRSRRYTRRRTGRRARTTANPRGALGSFHGIARPTVQRGYLPFNQSYMARLPFAYDDVISVSAEAATAGTALYNHTYRLNSVFDPMVQTASRAPLQYDVLAAVFKAYTVYAVKVDVNFYNPTLDGMNVGLRVRLPSAPDTSGMYIADLREQPRTILKQLNNTGSQSTRTSFYIRVRDIFGVTATQYQDGFYSAAVTSNPAAPTPTLEPFAISTIANGAATVRYNLRMTYYVRFYDPFQPLTIV